MMKKGTLLLLLILCWLSSFSNETYRVYVAAFQYSKEELAVLSNHVADDFQAVLQNCGKRFAVLDRANYVSWIEEANNLEVEEHRQLLYLQDVDYIVFGEIVYNGAKKYYTIEYGFEEVSTGSILVVDNIVFYTEADLFDAEKRQESIRKRIAEEFDLCHTGGEDSKEQMITIKEKVKHRMRDEDKDGVPDLIDQEPNTYPGAMVNAKGVAFTKETRSAIENPDGNTEGVDENMAAILKEMLPEMPVIQFLPNQIEIDEEAYTQLHQVAKIMEMYPAMYMKVIGNSKDINPMIAYRRSKKTIEFLTETYQTLPKRLIIVYKSLPESPINALEFEVIINEMENMSPPK